MSFGYQRQPQVFIDNTATLDAFLYGDDDVLVPQAQIQSVTFSILAPGDDPSAPSVQNAAGLVIEDGRGQYVVDVSVNAQAGDYKGVATFVYDDGNGNYGLVKSITVDYSVVDPFERAGASPADGAIRQCWLFIEDCFDSEQGGPWLRDMTLAVFDQSKVRGLLPSALLEINGQMPYTNYDETSFPYTNNDGEALLARALLIQTLRHLMRSYTEQPDVTNSPVAFMDRKRYQQAWNAIYQVELPEYKHLLNRWKLRGYDISSGALLIGTKAGRMLPAPLRSRNVGRGF